MPVNLKQRYRNTLTLLVKFKPGLFYANLAAIAAYFIAGLAGLTLAVPPGNSAAVWPAAGVALALVIISGYRILPGILIGSIFVQTTSFLDSSNAGTIISSIGIGTVISIGVCLQAWVASKLVKPVFRQDKGLIKERSILWFCLLAGPVGCLISASIGIWTLWLAGILTISDIPLAWGTWWIGDSIGVLTFSPVVLCFFAKPRYLWRQRITSVAVPLGILTALAFFAFRLSYQQEMRQVEDRFDKYSLLFKNELENYLRLHTESVESLKEFFDSASAVSDLDFPRYVRPKLARHPEIKALEWTPVITHEERASFETRIGSSIKVPNESGEMITSPVRELYFPIEYVEPYIGNENALGFDIRNNPIARIAAEYACENGAVAVTDAIRLVQEQQNQVGIVFYAPVYKKNALDDDNRNCDKLSGFAASVFRLEYQVNQIHQKLPYLKISVSIKNRTRLLYSDKAAADEVHAIPNQFQFNRSYQLPVANQVWALSFTPEAGFISHYSSWSIWLTIVGGLFISGISGICLLMLTGRTLQTEDKIKLRTAELNHEITERKKAARLLAIEKICLERVVENISLPDILDLLTRYIEELVHDTLSSILLLDPGGRFLNHGSAPNLPDSYTAAIDGLEIGPEVGSCGTAAYLNKQVIVSDIAHDSLWADYRGIALEYDLKACWSTPITIDNGKVMGTFALYFKTVKEPDAWAIEVVNRMANIAAVAILRKQAEEKLTYDASHDALTGLLNRREFERRALQLLESVKLDGNEHALCFMDLDQFKVINDTYGHTAGDEMLRQITLALQAVVRKQDTLARLGGDEFGLLMKYCSLDQAHRVVTLLQKVIQNYHFSWEGQSCRVGVSLGLVAITEAVPSLTELMKEADAACYMAKDMGRNRIHVYNPEDTEIALRHGEMQWATRLSQALEDNRLCLYAQAIVALDGRTDVHYELLIRMLDKDGEIIPPGAFLPAAERYNLASKLDHWVIETAFGLMAGNPLFVEKARLICISLSGQSLADPAVLDFIMAQLNETGIEGKHFCFEITETAAISNLRMAMKFISTLKDLGCRFALDDFGSGLSSFGYLKNLPVDFLKIDGMFVKDIVDDPIDFAMVKSINEIGQIMGMQTIAEFVENDDIKNKLKTIGVNYAQGFGVGKPVPFQDLLDSFPAPD